MSMKRTILIKEVKYSNQAKILLGMTKMMQVATKKMVTIHLVSNSSTSIIIHTMKKLVDTARYPPDLAGICTLTGCSLGEVSICPELD